VEGRLQLSLVGVFLTPCGFKLKYLVYRCPLQKKYPETPGKKRILNLIVVNIDFSLGELLLHVEADHI